MPYPAARALHSMLDRESVAAVVKAEYALPGVVRCAVWHRGFNDYFRVEAGEELYLLRVYSPGKYWVAGEGDLRFELELLGHLHRSGIACAPALPRVNGDVLGGVEAPEGTRYLALFAFVGGARLSPTAEIAGHLGDLVGRMHVAMDAFRSEHTRYHLDAGVLLDMAVEELTGAVGKTRSKELAAVLRVVDRVRVALDLVPTTAPSYGVIHADLHPGNMLVNNGEVTLLDFDHCGFGWRAYDLAPLLSREELHDPFLEAYSAVRPMTEIEIASEPTMAAARDVWNWGDMLRESDYIGGRGRYTDAAWSQILGSLASLEDGLGPQSGTTR